MPTLNSHTRCQVALAQAQAKTWQRVCLSQPATERQSGRKKNTERTTGYWRKLGRTTLKFSLGNPIRLLYFYRRTQLRMPSLNANNETLAAII